MILDETPFDYLTNEVLRENIKLSVFTGILDI
jgi:hypothetical protein